MKRRAYQQRDDGQESPSPSSSEAESSNSENDNDNESDNESENDMGSEGVSSSSSSSSSADDDSSDGHRNSDDDESRNSNDYYDDADNDLGSEGVSSDDDDSDGDDDDDDDNLPLSVRLQRQEERGARNLRDVRQRKQKALQVASQRLQTHRATDRKKSKHAPTEASSKRKAFFQRGAYQFAGLGVDINANRYKSNDPRMSNLAGHFNEDHFERNYEFVNDLRKQEIATLRQRIKAHKVTGKKGQKMRKKLKMTGTATLQEDKALLQEKLQEIAETQRKGLERAAKRNMKRKLRDDVAQGKAGVYYLKKSEQKKRLLEAKFDELRRQGGDKAVEKALAKKRKKNKSRDAGRFMKK